MNKIRNMFHRHHRAYVYTARFYVPNRPDEHWLVEECKCGRVRRLGCRKWDKR